MLAPEAVHDAIFLVTIFNIFVACFRKPGFGKYFSRGLKNAFHAEAL